MIKEYIKPIMTIAQKELFAFFSTPVAYIFLTAYIVLSSAFTFYIGNFFARGQANLNAFFTFQPWIFLLFIAAICMKSYAEEKKSGTIELLLTLPFKHSDIVLGKFIGTLLFVLLAIVLTFPLWISVNILGDPDNQIIFASYLGLILMAGLFIAIGLCLSALTKNQIVAFISAMMVFFLYLLSGTNVLLDFFSQWLPPLSDAIAYTSVLWHFDFFKQGAVELKSLFFFELSTLFWIVLNYMIVRYKNA